MADEMNGEREVYPREVFNAAHAYIAAFARMEQAMADGYNVHGAMSGIIGAEDNLRASLAANAGGEPVAYCFAEELQSATENGDVFDAWTKESTGAMPLYTHPSPPDGMAAEQALRKVLAAVQRYLPPDGPSAHDTLTEIIEVVDPWPLDQPTPTLTQGAAIAAGAVYADLPSECDSPEICSISKSCAGQFGSKRICASHGQAPSQPTPLEFTKEWCMAAAKAEEDSGADISAGVPFSPQAAQQALADADRRAGAAERALAACKEDVARFERVRDQMKDQWGVDRRVSFDVVWAEALALKTAQQAPDPAPPARVELSNLRNSAARPVTAPLSIEQIEAMPVWSKFVGLWPETRQEIVRAVEAMLAAPAAPSTPASGRWMPIETAPKDGKALLVWPPTWPSRICSVAVYNDDKYAKTPRPYWERDDALGKVMYSRGKPPLLWQPLPASPTIEGESNGAQ